MQQMAEHNRCRMMTVIIAANGNEQGQWPVVVFETVQ
jgi:hypothetical protein